MSALFDQDSGPGAEQRPSEDQTEQAARPEPGEDPSAAREGTTGSETSAAALIAAKAEPAVEPVLVVGAPTQPPAEPITKQEPVTAAAPTETSAPVVASAPPDVVTARSTGSPAASPLEPPAVLPASVHARLVAYVRRLRWSAAPTAPARVPRHQRVYSLVMLLTLAITVGVISAGILVTLVLITIAAVGHGSG